MIDWDRGFRDAWAGLISPCCLNNHFSLLPSASFLLLSTCRCFQLSKRLVVVKKPIDPLAVSKLVTLISLSTVQVALVVLYSLPAYNLTRASLAAACSSLAATFALVVLSYYEHYRSLRPSFLLSVYLGLNVIFDVSQARSLWLRGSHKALAAIFTGNIFLKLTLLLLESVEKQQLLREPFSRYSPETLGSLFNRSVFWWLNSLLLQGSKSIVTQETLLQLDNKLTSNRLANRIRSVWAGCDKSRKHSLLLVTLMAFRRSVLLVVFPRLCLSGFKILQPLLIYRVVTLLSAPESKENATIGNALIGASALIYLGISFSTAWYKHELYRCITSIRGSLISLIYEQTLELKQSVLADTAAVTLVNADIDQIAAGMEISDALWATPIELALVIFILSKQIGLACIAPVAISLGCATAAIVLSKISKGAQKIWMDAVQHRISTTSTMLDNIKSIRMTGLSSKAFANLHQLRVTELNKSKPYRKTIAMSIISSVFPQAISPMVAIVIYFLLLKNRYEDSLSPARIFSSLSLVGMLGQPMMMFMFAFPRFVGSIACYDRIEKYLIQSERVSNARSSDDVIPQQQFLATAKSSAIELDFQVVRLTERANMPKDLINIRGASFNFSFDTEVILNDLDLVIRSRDLIMLTGPVGSGKSALLLALLGEMTQTKGSMVRQQNIGIAYCSQEPWLPNLSIDRIICGPSEFNQEWYDKVIHACDLSSDFSSLRYKDKTVIGSRGICLSTGQRQRLALARALYSRRPLLLLDDVTSGLDPATEQVVVDRVLGRNGICRQYGATVVLATHKAHFGSLMDSIFKLTVDGCLKKVESPADLTDSINPFNTEAKDNVTVHRTHRDEPPNINRVTLAHDMSHKTGDIKLYVYYMKAMGIPFILATLGALSCFTFSLRFPDIWLKWWSDTEEQHPGEHQNLFLGVYVALASCTVLFFFLVMWPFLVVLVPSTSIKLHKRFSQDMSLLDMRLPVALVQTVDGLFDTIAEAFLIGQASPWAVLIYPPLLVALYVLQRFYLRTSRQIRHLDLEAKSPLLTHFRETCEGIITIRAFGWQHELSQLNSNLLDESQKPFYLLYSIQCWLTLVLNLIVTVVLIVVMILATQLHKTSGGALGVALVNVSYATQTLPYLIQSWTSLETSMGALTRLRSFVSTTPSEHLPVETSQPGQTWPTSGNIELVDLSVGYRADSEPVLHGINLKIPAVSKIGICGRTGSGKSSFILSLLRLTEIQHGNVLIDGTDISKIPRETIRQHLAVHPQDPLLLTGFSIRANLDPFGAASDEALTSALSDVGMLNWVTSRGGLDAVLETNSLSAGQQQLLSLVRLLLSQSRILILDEATSRVDRDTERKITELVSDRFQDRSIIAVAHRLETIRDFNVIVVLDQGRIVEVGHPDQLLRDPASQFRDIWTKKDEVGK